MEVQLLKQGMKMQEQVQMQAMMLQQKPTQVQKQVLTVLWLMQVQK
jgi:hypothetical protein